VSKVVFGVSVSLHGFLAGPPLFDGTPGRVERTRVSDSPAAVHLRYAVAGSR
jgi:hypothetical protein